MRLALAATLFLLLSQTAARPALSVTAEGRAQQPGELVVLTVAPTSPGTAIRARAFARDLTAFQDDAGMWRVLVGIDLEVKPGSYPVSIVAGPQRTTYDLVVVTKAFPTRNLKVDNAFVNPPVSAQARIAQDNRDLERCWREAAITRLWTTGFVRPVPQEANSAFGTRSVFNGQPRRPHSGADFPSPAGTPVKAPGAGRVVLAKDLYFSGNTVVIDHGLGVFSMLAHLSAMTVKDGASVAGGAVVGRVGATGRVTGPHLHWTVRVGGARVDPLSLLAVLGG